MAKTESIDIILILSISLIVFILFILFVFIWYRLKRNKQIHEAFLKEEKYKEDLQKANVAIEEKTLNQVSTEMHDNLGQILSLAKIELSLAEQAKKVDKKMICDIKSNISFALEELRSISKGLNSDYLKKTTLTDAITQHIERISKMGLIEINFYIKGAERDLNEHVKLILFRILQEATQNILKHAKASKVEVNCFFKESILMLLIKDNGIGFELNQNTVHGLGISNMTNRAKLIGGDFKIKSSPMQGASIFIKVPYERI